MGFEASGEEVPEGLAGMQRRGASAPLPPAAGEQLRFPLRRKPPPEVVY
jgi:hypothetical protein